MENKQEKIHVAVFEGVNITKGLSDSIAELMERSPVGRTVLEATLRVIRDQMKKTKRKEEEEDVVSELVGEKTKETKKEDQRLSTRISMPLTAAFQIALIATEINERKKREEEKEKEKEKEKGEITPRFMIGHSSGIAAAVASSCGWRSGRFEMESLVQAAEKIVFALFWASFQVEEEISKTTLEIGGGGGGGGGTTTAGKSWSISVKAERGIVERFVEEFNKIGGEKEMVQIAGSNSSNRTNVVGHPDSISEFQKILPKEIETTILSLTQPVHFNRFQHLLPIVCCLLFPPFLFKTNNKIFHSHISLLDKNRRRRQQKDCREM